MRLRCVGVCVSPSLTAYTRSKSSICLVCLYIITRRKNKVLNAKEQPGQRRAMSLPWGETKLKEKQKHRLVRSFLHCERRAPYFLWLYSLSLAHTLPSLLQFYYQLLCVYFILWIFVVLFFHHTKMVRTRSGHPSGSRFDISWLVSIITFSLWSTDIYIYIICCLKAGVIKDRWQMHIWVQVEGEKAERREANEPTPRPRRVTRTGSHQPPSHHCLLHAALTLLWEEEVHDTPPSSAWEAKG